MSRTLLEQWKDIAYDESADRATLQRFWGTYFQIEKEIYEQLLSNPDEEVKGTVKELAEVWTGSSDDGRFLRWNRREFKRTKSD